MQIIRRCCLPFDRQYNNGRIVLFEVVITIHGRHGSGGGELTINNNDNKMSENAAASLLT